MRRLLTIAISFSLLFAGLSVGTAAAPQADNARSEHQRIVDFWTVDKIRQAVPRDFVFDQRSGRFIPAARGGTPGPPGGGGGDGGGGGGGDVDGAPWDGTQTIANNAGKVLFELGVKDDGTPAYWICSATVVNDTMTNRSLVLTAAHCAYENQEDATTAYVEKEFAEHWMFIPNYDAEPVPLTASGSFCGATAFGCWTADALVVHEGFASAGGFNGTAIQHDFAFAVVGNGGKGGGLAEDVVGTQTMSFTEVSKGTPVHAFGYPAGPPYAGDDLVYCAGGVNFDNRLFKLTYKLGCDMTGGASGGPWGTGFGVDDGDGVLMSVNSYKYGVNGDTMYGPKFNTTTRATYDLATSPAMNQSPGDAIANGG